MGSGDVLILGLLIFAFANTQAGELLGGLLAMIGAMGCVCGR